MHMHLANPYAVVATTNQAGVWAIEHFQGAFYVTVILDRTESLLGPFYRATKVWKRPRNPLADNQHLEQIWSGLE